MAKRTATAHVASAADAQLAEARTAFDVARKHTEKIANSEVEALGSRDDYLEWSRQKRLAEINQEELAAEVSRLEVAAECAKSEQYIAQYAKRYAVVAARSRDVAEMFANDLPKAWSIISAVLTAAAELEIEAAIVMKAMPAGFQPDQRLVDPEAGRRREGNPEQILSADTIELRCDAKSGNILADQSAHLSPGTRVISKRFRCEKYQPHRPASVAGPFWKTLNFPRLDTAGVPLFDGSKCSSASEVLAQLQAPRTVPAEPALTRLKPLDQPATSASHDLGPAV